MKLFGDSRLSVEIHKLNSAVIYRHKDLGVPCYYSKSSTLAFHVKFVSVEMALEWIFLRFLQFPLLIVVPPSLHSHPALPAQVDVRWFPLLRYFILNL